MAELADYAAFVAVADQGSLTAAGRHLGRSLQAVSRSLIALEREFGVTLIARTTRRSRLTDEGRALLARLRPALAEIALARETIGAQAKEASGTIRIAAPALFGPTYLLPLLAAFLARHPGIDIDLVLDQAYADPIAEGVDLALRFGELPSSSMKARRIGALRQGVFATPSYLREAGMPRQPEQLASHRCIIRTSARESATWSFSRDGHDRSVVVSGVFRSDSPAACNEAAALGLGIGRAPLWQVRSLLDTGRLVLVLPDWDLPSMPVHLVWPAAALTSRVRLLIDHLARGLDLARL